MKTETANSVRVVLITGASSGFGKACAHYLGQKGYHVYGTSRSAVFSEEAIEPAPDSQPYRLIPMDVRETSSVKKSVAHILNHEGRIDVVVNNAGIAVAGAMEDISVDEFKGQLETNLFGIFRVCQAVLPQMRKQEAGYIINISSIGGLMGLPFQGAYSASKFALEGMSEALRIEVKPFGIHVVLIEPGDFKTGITNNRIRAKACNPSSVYAERFETALSLMENEERNGSDPRQLAILVEKIIHQKKPKVRYTIGKPEQRLSTLYKRLAPSLIFERSMMKYYDLI